MIGKIFSGRDLSDNYDNFRQLVWGDNLDNPGQLLKGAPPNRAALVSEAMGEWDAEGGKKTNRTKRDKSAGGEREGRGRWRKVGLDGWGGKA